MTHTTLKADNELLASGRKAVQIESQAVKALEERLGGSFIAACRAMLGCEGRVIVMGVGKSGHIGRKIAATLASTGTPAFFVHPGEAGHGDLGMITHGDILIAISYSGNATEILGLLPVLRRLKIQLIAMTGNPQSPLAKASDISLDVSVATEACPLDLAPTASTTTALVMGDALAVTLLEARGFTREDFAISHPSGALGKRLILRADDLMRSGKDLPIVHDTTPLLEALAEMSAKSLGMTTVVNGDGTLLGIFTDGDLRRTLDKHNDVHTLTMKQLMTRSPITILENTLAVEAMAIMEERKITTIVVVSTNNKPLGVLHMHDLLSAGIA